MDSRNKVLIVATIFSALFLNLLAQANAKNAPKMSLQTLMQMVDECKKSGDLKMCKKLVNDSLQAVRQESDSIQDFLGQTIKSNPQYSQALKTCVSYFGDTTKALVIRKGDLKMGEASYNVHTALDSVQSCETALANEKVNIVAVSDRIKRWKDLFSTAYSLVTQNENLSSP